MSEPQATDATETPGVFESLNQWLLSLPAERKAILREDKWMLAEAAFAAGRAVGRQDVDHLIKYSYVALREEDGSTWGGQYFDASGCSYAHEKTLSRAYQAESVENLHSAMAKQLCGYGGSEQAIGRYTILKVARGNIVEEVATGVVPIVLKDKQLREMTPFPRDLIRSIYEDMTQAMLCVASRHASAFEVESAWHCLCATSHILGVELSARPFDPADTKAEMKGAMERLGKAIKNGDVTTAAAPEIGRLVSAVIMVAADKGVQLKAKGFLRAT